MKKVISICIVLLLCSTMVLCAFAEENLRLGTVTGNTYTNFSLKIGCTLPEPWYFFNEEEILAQNQLTKDMVGENIAAKLDDINNLVDMIASSNETGDNVNITVEKLSPLYALIYSPEKYIEMTIPQVEQAISSIMEVIDIQKSTAPFLGKDAAAIRIHATIQDVDFYEICVVLKHGRYIVSITAGTFYENNTQDILDQFFAVD